MRQALHVQQLLSGDARAYRTLYALEQARADGPVSESELIRRASARMVPNVRLLFGGFRLMAAVGTLMLVLFVLGFLMRKKLQDRRYGNVLLLVPMLLPLPWLATFAGWIVAEAGRQPWVVYGYLSTAAGARLPTLAHGFIGTVLVVSIYLVLTVIFVLLSLWWIRLGPASSDSPTDTRPGTDELPLPAAST